MDGSWIGPQTPQEMMKKLMPISDDDLALLPKNVKFNLPKRKGMRPLEKHLYQLFEKTIRKFKISPKFKFFIGADGRPKAGDVQVPYRPDGGLREMATSATQRPDHGRTLRPRKDKGAASKSSKPIPAEVPAYKAFNWFEDGLVVEFKKSSKMDPFLTMDQLKKEGAASEGADRPRVPFVQLTEREVKTRGQLAIYAKEVFDHQHRTHTFQLLVCGRFARFIFWDHSGAIVSDSFNYVKSPQLLAEFFWRYNYMDRQTRGWDASVKIADGKERRMFKEKLEEFIKNMNDENHKQRRLPHAEDTLDPAFPVYKVNVVDDSSGLAEDVLIQRPFFHVHTALGRATRGYIAFLLSDHTLKFLKDTWRVKHERLVPERTLYSQLEASGVPNVPRDVSGGDVTANGENETTRCLQWATEQKLSVLYTTVRDFRHHRLLQELAYPVQSAASSYEFVFALRDCLTAMEAAGRLRNLLHRDMSIGNVMFSDVEGIIRGILADWDHAAEVLTSKGTVYQNFRTGTWQFMSIALLQEINKAHDVLDDFESLFWVLLYGSLHYFKHTQTKDSLLDMKMFDEYDDLHREDRVVRVGGGKKLIALGKICNWVTFASPALHELIERVAGEFDNYYDLKSKCGPDAASTPASDAQLPQGEEGVFIKKMRAPPALSYPLPPAPKKKSKDEYRKEYDELREKLSKASYWMSLFDEALNSAQWKPDAAGKDQYPPQTEKQRDKEIAIRNTRSLATGEELASQDVQTALYLRMVEEARALDEANRASDEDDGLESCTYEDDEDDDEDSDEDVDEHREDFWDREFPPISPSVGPSHPPLSRSASPASILTSDALPLPLVPQRSYNLPTSSHTVYSLRSEGSSRLKRSIHEVTAASPVEEPGEAGLPPPKKSRSRSRAKVQAAPTDRRTRSSSKKSTVTTRKDHDEEDDAADADTEDTKEARPKRGLRAARSGELNTVQPRREGLRPRPSRRTLFRST